MILVDSNVIIDVTTASEWSRWSEPALEAARAMDELAINPIIYAEVAAGYARIEDLESALGQDYHRLSLPYEAGFMAARAFQEYRRRGGVRTAPIPDFYIGAHAVFESFTLLTRDPRGYRSYFPQLELITP